MKRHAGKMVFYKREKGKIEIYGFERNVKFQIWFDLVTSRLTIILALIAIALFRKADLVSLFCKWLEDIF